MATDSARASLAHEHFHFGVVVRALVRYEPHTLRREMARASELDRDVGWLVVDKHHHTEHEAEHDGLWWGCGGGQWLANKTGPGSGRG